MLNMYVCGCDLGSATGKAVILDDSGIAAWAVVKSTTNPEKTADIVLKEALGKCGLSSVDELQYIIGTGYGRQGVSFIEKNISEITCHAYGAYWMNPGARTIIDVGGQDCKAIALGDDGKIIDYVMNDKCAAGTGRFLEAMARVMDMELEELAKLSLQSQNPVHITKQCSVFAESEVVTLINSGRNEADIAAGIHDSIASRLYSLANKVGIRPEVVMTGGGAMNKALIRSLEKILGMSIAGFPGNPQIAGALGAALFARERAKKLSANKGGE